MISAHKIAALFAAIYLLLGGSLPVHAAQGGQGGQGGWTVTFSISVPYASVPGGVVSNTLSAGVRDGATSGYDPAMDTVSLLESDDPIQAYFPHGAVVKASDADGSIQGWSCPEPEPGYTVYQCSLWRDFRGMNEVEQLWTFEVLSTLNGATVSLNWRLEGDPDDLAQVKLSLTDLSSAPPWPPTELDPSSPSKNYQYTSFFSAAQKFSLRRFEIRMKNSAPLITPSVLPPATQNAAYSASLNLVGGGGSWSLEAGELPPGLGLGASSGRIEGLPEIEGVYSFTVRAVDPVMGLTASRSYSIQVHPPLAITTSNFPEQVVNAPYAVSLQAEGGAGTYQWSLASGTLPGGITLSGNGLLSGTFLVPGLYDFTIRVMDTETGAESVRTFRMTVTEPTDERAPEAVTDLRELYADSGTVVLSWSAPPDDSLTGTAAAYDLRYLMDCASPLEMESRWSEAIMADGEPRPQPGILHIYTLSGLQAVDRLCIALRSMDASGHLSTLSNVIALSDSGSAGGENSRTVAVQLPLHQGFNLISLPVIPTTNRVLSVEDNAVVPETLWRWYSFLPGLTEPEWQIESFTQPGFGYFIYVPQSEGTLNVQGLPVTDPEYRVRLQGGWNMVGNPYGVEVLLKEVRIREIRETGDGQIKSFEEASRSGWVGNSLYGFNGLSYEFFAVNSEPPEVLQPGMGFWLHARDEGVYEMIFERPPQP